MTDSAQDDLIRRFEDAAHEIHGDATEYLAKRDHDGLVEYVRGDVNASWVFFKAGSEDARSSTAKEIADWLDADAPTHDDGMYGGIATETLRQAAKKIREKWAERLLTDLEVKP